MQEVTAADLRDIYLGVDAMMAANQRAWQRCLAVLRDAEIRNIQMRIEMDEWRRREFRPIASEKWHRRCVTDTVRW